MQDLGALGSSGNSSTARDISENGTVVGTSNGKAFLWTASGGMIDLASLITDPLGAWSLQEAFAINDLGQIVGYGSINGSVHAFLLTPEQPEPVPEPATMLLLGSGLAGLAGFRKRFWRR
jgi:probable HAF family extracellular repeat protein